MSKLISSSSEIPDAPFYVTATDTFLSGWGRAEGKKNRVILPCETFEEAQSVAEYADSRSDMSRVDLSRDKPKIQKEYIYSLMSRETAHAWYPGSFLNLERIEK